MNPTENLSVSRLAGPLPIVPARELLIAAGAFTLFFLLFTYQEIFFLDALYLDDHHRYTLGLENRIHDGIAARNLVRAYVIFPLYKLLSIDPMWARLAQVLLFMVPLATCTYYCLRRYAAVESATSFFTPLLASSLPALLQIPYFIDGSYTVQGLLVYLLSVIMAIESLERDDRFTLASGMGAILVYWLSIEMMDHAMFMIPFTVLLLFFFRHLTYRFKRKLIIALPLLLIACYYLLQSVAEEHAPQASPNLDIFFARLESFVYVGLPYSYASGSTARNSFFLAFLFFSLLCFCLGLGKWREQKLLIGAIIWMLVSSIAFLTVSEWYQPRYVYIAGFAMNFALLFSLEMLVSRMPMNRAMRASVFVGLLVALTCFAQVNRHENMSALIERHNPAYEQVAEHLRGKNLPKDSQVIISQSSYRVITGGYHWYSTGFVRYVARRDDLTGHVGQSRNFFDPFGVSKRLFSPDHKMNGIDPSLPLFIYKLDCKAACDMTDLRYVLRWREDGWELFEYDADSGMRVSIHVGAGFETYLNKLKALGLTQEQVMFGEGSV